MTNDAVHGIEPERQKVDWKFIKSSTLLSSGTVVARVLGMAFSLVLAKAFVPEEYGSIRYLITLAMLCSAITQPFGQHVLARFVGSVASEPERLQRILPNLWVLLASLLALTLGISAVVLGLMNRLHFGTMSMIFGISIYYAYWGLCRGLSAERRLVAVSVGSNVAQLVAVSLAIFVFDIRSTVLVTAIFGLSYLVPIAIGQIVAPVGVGFDRAGVRRAEIWKILKFSVPIWGSHAGYVAYNSIVVLILVRYSGVAAVGVYALANTLARAFLFVPEAIATLLMPRIAGGRSASRGSDVAMLQGLTLAVNAIALVGYLLLVEWFVTTAFAASYFDDGIETYVIMAGAMILLGQHGILTAVLVGAGEAHFETVSRAIALAATALVALILVPGYGPSGAALAMFTGAASGLAYYGVLWRRGRGFSWNTQSSGRH